MCLFTDIEDVQEQSFNSENVKVLGRTIKRQCKQISQYADEVFKIRAWNENEDITQGTKNKRHWTNSQNSGAQSCYREIRYNTNKFK